MTRIKWLKFKHPYDDNGFNKFSKLLSKHSYSDNDSAGFLVDELRADYLSSRFISKKVIKQEIETPFGEILDQEFVSFETIRFRLTSSGPGMELVNPTRSIQMFLNHLSLAANFQISVSDLKVDLKKWVSRIARESEELVTLKTFECQDIKLGNNLTAALSVYGSGEIEKEIKNMLGNKKYTLRRIKIAIGKCNVVISSNCSAQIRGGDIEKVSNLLRSTIES